MRKTTTGRALIVIQAIMSILQIYFHTFIIARFYDLFDQTEAIRVISIYYLIAYSTLVIVFVALGNRCKKDALTILRISILLNVATLFLIMKLDLMRYYVLIAITFGASQACYYAPFTNLVSSISENNQIIQRFWTSKSLTSNIINFVFPITIGAYLEVSSFYNLTAFLLAIVIIQLIATLKIKYCRNDSAEKFDLMRYWKKLFSGKNTEGVFTYYKIVACDGIIGSILDKLITIVILYMYNSSFSLGFLNTVFAIIQIALIAFVKKKYNTKNVNSIVKISTLLTTISLVVFINWVTTGTFIVYKFLSVIAITFLELFNSIARYNCLDKNEFSNMEQEHQTTCEIVIGISRMIGFLFLLLVTTTSIEILGILKISLVVCAIVIYLYGKYIGKSLM